MLNNLLLGHTRHAQHCLLFLSGFIVASSVQHGCTLLVGIRKAVQVASTITFQNAKKLQPEDRAREDVMCASKLTALNPTPLAQPMQMKCRKATDSAAPI